MVIFEHYRQVLELFISRNGNKPVNLFAVLKMDDLVDKWSVLLAADWINDDTRKDAFNSLTTILVETFSTEEISEIARVGVWSTTNHLAELFLDNFQPGQHIQEDARINGNVIHEGYIIACVRSSATAGQMELLR